MGWEPWSSGYGWLLMFERSWVQILAPYTGWTFGHFSHWFVVKTVLFVWKDEINEKEAGVGPYLKKLTVSLSKTHTLCLSQIHSLSHSLTLPISIYIVLSLTTSLSISIRHTLTLSLYQTQTYSIYAYHIFSFSNSIYLSYPYLTIFYFRWTLTFFSLSSSGICALLFKYVIYLSADSPNSLMSYWYLSKSFVFFLWRHSMWVFFGIGMSCGKTLQVNP